MQSFTLIRQKTEEGDTRVAPEDSFVAIVDGLEIFVPKNAKNNSTWLIDVKPYKTEKRLASAVQGTNIFVSNQQEILSAITNNLVVTPNLTSNAVELPNTSMRSIDNHRSGCLVSFFNHIFFTKGRTLWWTDLDNSWNWQPHPHSEADFREIEWEQTDITALCRGDDKLYIHFPNAIYDVVYTGKPLIVKIEARVVGMGCAASRALIVHNSVQFFMGTDNFYAWSVPTGLQVIGQDVWKKFVQSTDNLSKVWAYVDQRNNEICWCTETEIWAFNFFEKIWCKYSTDGVVDQATVPWSKPQQSLEESVAIIDTVSFDGLENVMVVDGAVCREARGGDGVDVLMQMETPFLESDAITYGDLHFNKRCDLLMIDARYTWPWKGVRVKISGTDYVTQEPRFVDVGVWTDTNVSRQIDFRSAVGKVLRFRFELEECGNLNGRLPDGRWLLDGLHDTQHLVEPVGYFAINAWGERVDLPQTLVGPDK